MSTGYLNQSSISQSVYVGWDGLTPPTLPIPPWVAIAGVQPGDFTLTAVFSSAAFATVSSNPVRVENDAYPVSQSQQNTGFRIGGWLAIPAVNRNCFFGLNDGTSALPHDIGLNVDAANNWDIRGRVNGGAYTTVSVSGPAINSWQFIALEVFNNVVTLYGDFTGHSTVNPPPADQSETVTVYSRVVGSASGTVLYPAVFPYAQSASFIHLRLTYFSSPAAALLPGPSSAGFPTPVYNPYFVYKNVREAVNIYNNLMLGQ